MSLMQIAEPNQSAQPHQHRFGLGIDLGTTRSLVAVVRSGKAQVLEASSETDTLLPSVVYYPATGNPLIGHDALAHLAEYHTTQNDPMSDSFRQFRARLVPHE